MSVAPGSGRGSFRVLYIALIYMSLEINLACILPHRPPPLRLLMPPSPPWPQPPSPPAMVQGWAPVGGRGARWQLLGCGAAWHCHLAWDGLTAAGVWVRGAGGPAGAGGAAGEGSRMAAGGEMGGGRRRERLT